MQEYPLILASLYGSAYVRKEVPLPEGIAFAQLLREQEGPNRETPIFLLHTGYLVPVLEHVVSFFQTKKHYFPALVPRNSIYLFNLSDTDDWKALHELTAYIVRHS